MILNPNAIGKNIQYTIKPCHISEISAGDIIHHNGRFYVLCNHDIKHCDFMGITILGDSYNLGNKPVQRADVFHARPTNIPT